LLSTVLNIIYIDQQLIREYAWIILLLNI
jgi:hypothetical protein